MVGLLVRTAGMERPLFLDALEQSHTNCYVTSRHVTSRRFCLFVEIVCIVLYCIVCLDRRIGIAYCTVLYALYLFSFPIILLERQAKYSTADVRQVESQGFLLQKQIKNLTSTPHGPMMSLVIILLDKSVLFQNLAGQT